MGNTSKYQSEANAVLKTIGPELAKGFKKHFSTRRAFKDFLLRHQKSDRAYFQARFEKLEAKQAPKS